MRLVAVFAVLFALCGLVRAEDLATKLESAGKPGSPEYREYLKKKAEREKLLAPIRAELKACLANKTKDPNDALCAIEVLSATALELGVQEEELNQLQARSQKIRETISEYIEPLDTHLAQYAATRYSSVPAANTPMDASVLSLLIKQSSYPMNTAEDFFYASRGVYWQLAVPHRLENDPDREKDIQQVVLGLATLQKHQPADDWPPYCQVIWENKVLHSMYLTKRWDITPLEAGVSATAYKEWQKKAEEIAKRQAKELLAELKKPKPEWLLICFAKEHKLELLFSLIEPKTVGTTPKAIAALIDRAEKAWQN